MDPNAMKVLADALRDALPEKDAADVLRWAEFPDAVRMLIEHQRLTGDGRCVNCGELSGRAHAEDCVLMEATRQLGITWVSAEHDLDRAHAEALGEASERYPVTPK